MGNTLKARPSPVKASRGARARGLPRRAAKRGARIGAPQALGPDFTAHVWHAPDGAWAYAVVAKFGSCPIVRFAATPDAARAAALDVATRAHQWGGSGLQLDLAWANTPASTMFMR